LIEAYFTRQDSTARIDRHRNPDAKRTRISATSSGRVWVAEIQAQGTATGFEGLAAGRCDIAMASRAIREDEERRMAALGTTMLTSPATEHEIGLDGVAVIVHPNNLLFALQLSQLADVFSGKVRDWSQLGGQPGPIHVLRRDEHSGTYDTFQHLVLGEGGFSPNAQRFDDNSLLADAVASDPAAIGFVGLASVRNAKALALNEPGAPRLLPSPFTVATESYVLSRRLYLYTSYAPRSRWAQDFVRFATSPEGQLVVDRAGFVNNDLLLERPHCGETCSARYKDTIVGAQRVSVELRFDTASRVLERRARRDLDRLVTFLQHHPGARLLLLGFSDASGHANDNLELSRQRAQTVARELQARGIAPRLVAGFGAENAVATNDTLTGRERNRRVEVWIQLEP
jgi:phosphate transport system substrate-binding protein